MAEKPSEKRNPGRLTLGSLFWRLQIYGQNNPRQYARRSGLVTTGLILLVLAPVFLLMLPRDGIPPDLVWVVVGILVGAAILGGGFFYLLRRLFLWVIGGVEIPEDAQARDLKAASRQVRRGELSGRPEVDALGRRLSVQTERMMSFRYAAPVLAALVLNTLNLGLQLVSGPATATQATLLVLSLLMLAAYPFVVRWRRGRAQAFRRAHDERYGEPGDDPPRKPWVSGPRNAPQR